jgi:hypothetical protein
MGTLSRNAPGFRQNVVWYGIGAAGYLLVVAWLAVAARLRPEPADVRAQRQTEKAMADVRNSLREARGEEVDFEFARPVEADITRHLSTSFDGKERMLLLKHRKITDADLAKIRTLGDGLYISFEESKLPPRALRHLAGLEVTTLELARSSVTDDDLADLPQVKKVQKLFLDGAKVGDAALPHLALCPGLRDLHLKNTAVTDKGVEGLTRLQTLSDLDLEGTKVTDETLPHLLRLRLDRLQVGGTKVSDLGLEKVAGTYPRLLDVRGSRVTERGAQDLQKRCPTITVGGVGPPDPVESEIERAKRKADEVKKLIPKF